MKTVCLVLFLLCVYSINAQLSSNATLIPENRKSGIKVRDGLRKIMPWLIRYENGNSIRVNRIVDGQNSNATNRHIMPLWTAGHERTMSHSPIIPHSSSHIHTTPFEMSNSTVNHIHDTKNFLKNILNFQHKSVIDNVAEDAIKLINTEETKLIRDFDNKKNNLGKIISQNSKDKIIQKIYEQPHINLKEIERLDQKWNLGLNSTK
jgi:hypothetical protein